MKIFNTKLYVLEEMTQEDLNNLALERNTLAEENKMLKQQLKYLRSGEYYNQLRFENEMLQNVVDTNGVPSEVYDYIECTHRNTELLEKNEQLKKELEQSNAVVDTNKELAESFHKEKQQLKEQLKKLKKITKQFLIYLNKNKSVLNNPNILDFYINIKEILNKYIGE